MHVIGLHIFTTSMGKSFQKCGETLIFSWQQQKSFKYLIVLIESFLLLDYFFVLSMMIMLSERDWNLEQSKHLLYNWNF